MESASNVSCRRCRAFLPQCFCGHIVRLAPSQTRLVILMHASEAKKKSSTALLAREIFGPRCEIRVVGSRSARLALDDLVAPSASPYYPFPCDSAPELTPQLAAELPRPLTLLIPDGSWRQARRIRRRNGQLHAVPSLRLAAGSPARYQLRRQSRACHVCTLEAAARALTVLEGFDFQSPIEALLDVFNERLMGGRLPRPRAGAA